MKKVTIKLPSNEILSNYSIVRESTTHVQVVSPETLAKQLPKEFGEWINKDFILE